jgi:F-type H+-transporting ATPase subunit delta
MARLVSKIYGDALFSLALEEEKIEELQKETTVVRATIEENPSFMSVICHPELTQEKKLEVLDEVFQGALSDELMGLFRVMVRKGRIGELLSVLDYFDEQVREHLGIGTVNVSTPMPLSDQQKEQIEKRLLETSRYETLSVNYHIDESLLGGIVIRIGDRILDNSIRSQMDAMSRQLSKVKLS